MFEDKSTGVIQSDTQGIYYRSQATGRYIRAYADCIVVSK